MDDRPFLTIVEPTPSSEYLDDEDLTAIVDRVYSGKTLLDVCGEMKISRAQIDIAVRRNDEFREALNMALSALGDISAESAKQLIEDPILAIGTLTCPHCLKEISSGLPIAQRQHLLRLANSRVEFAKWFADRTSNYYKSKSPEKRDNKKPKRLVTSVPPREVVKD